MEKLTETFVRYLRAKQAAGSDVIQLFDSWVGALSVDDYLGVRRALLGPDPGAVDVPTIHFGTGTSHLLPTMAEAGGDVIGLDWRIPLDVGLGARRPRPRGAGQPRPDRPARSVRARPGRGGADPRARRTDGPGHVFNLGHGVLPGTDPAVLGRLVELVHERTATVAA